MTENYLNFALTLFGLVLGGLVTMFGFLIKKWTGGLEKHIELLDERKVDTKLCEKEHANLCKKIEMFQDTLQEVRSDVKDLGKAVFNLAQQPK